MFESSVARAFAASSPKVSPMLDGFNPSTAGMALLGQIPEKNAIMKAGLATRSLSDMADLQQAREEMAYNLEARDKQNRQNLLFGLLGSGAQSFAGGALAQAGRLGLKLPSTASTAAELSQWQALSDRYRQNLSRLTKDGMGGSWEMFGAGVSKL